MLYCNAGRTHNFFVNSMEVAGEAAIKITNPIIFDPRVPLVALQLSDTPLWIKNKNLTCIQNSCYSFDYNKRNNSCSLLRYIHIKYHAAIEKIWESWFFVCLFFTHTKQLNDNWKRQGMESL